MHCNHKVETKQGKIIARKDCPCCQSNIKFVQAITKPNVTQQEIDKATTVYLQEGGR